MIVDPDFPDHWKTQMLVDLLGEAAPIYVIRLWAHCQRQGQTRFDDLPPAALKSICRFAGQANQLESSLAKTGFISRDASGVLIVEGWAEYNAPLVSRWENGKKGGRPKKPEGNRGITEQEPEHNLSETNRSRVDEIRNTKSNTPPDEGVGSDFFVKAEKFLKDWNATNGARKCGHLPHEISCYQSLLDRLNEPNWFDRYPAALAKFPLRGLPDGMDVARFLEERTIWRVLENGFDYTPKGQSQVRTAAAEQRLPTLAEARAMKEKLLGGQK